MLRWQLVPLSMIALEARFVFGEVRMYRDRAEIAREIGAFQCNGRPLRALRACWARVAAALSRHHSFHPARPRNPHCRYTRRKRTKSARVKAAWRPTLALRRARFCTRRARDTRCERVTPTKSITHTSGAL